MILARTDHQIGTGLCELHYFNAIAPKKRRSDCKNRWLGGGDSHKAWPPVNSVSGVIDDATSGNRATSSRLCDSCIDVLRLGSVIIDGYDVATANDEIDRAACLYSDIVGYQYGLPCAMNYRNSGATRWK